MDNIDFSISVYRLGLRGGGVMESKFKIGDEAFILGHDKPYPVTIEAILFCGDDDDLQVAYWLDEGESGWRADWSMSFDGEFYLEHKP